MKFNQLVFTLLSLFAVYSCQLNESIEELSSNDEVSLEANLKSAGASNLWPGGIIPYVFDSSVSAYGQQRMLWAMYAWNMSTNQTINFILRTNETHYIEIKKIDSSLTPNASTGCPSTGFRICNINEYTDYVILHELGHVIGLDHEHQKINRDSYIEINWDDPRITSVGQYSTMFNKHYYSESFDFNSIMLGACDGRAINLATGQPYYQNSSISSTDGAAVQQMYSFTYNDWNWTSIENPYVVYELINSTTLRLNWELVPNAAKYLVHCRKMSSADAELYTTTTSNSITINLGANENISDYASWYITPVSNKNITSQTVSGLNWDLQIRPVIQLDGPTNPNNDFSYEWRVIQNYDTEPYNLSDLSNIAWEVTGDIEKFYSNSNMVAVRAKSKNVACSGTIKFRDYDVIRLGTSSRPPVAQINVTFEE